VKIDGKIFEWYEKNRRDLPWRRTKDPYLVWISEVILQQTRVSQGLDYYNRFVERFPDVGSLAAAGEEEILKLWQGLGYYSRARNLHRAARHVVDHLGGRIPDSYEGLMTLKGVGTYTASAISSICFGEPRAVVDGNVSRVIARLYGLMAPVNSPAGSRAVAVRAGALMEDVLARGGDPGTHNQSMMEFGALHCLPGSPRCGNCPLSGSCAAFQNGTVDRIPVRLTRPEPVERWIYYYIFHHNGTVLITKRGDRDIWRSLYQFPAVESHVRRSEGEIPGIMLREVWEGMRPPVKIGKISHSIRHRLTHRVIHARFIHTELNSRAHPLPSGWIRIPFAHLDQYPVPRLIQRYMEVVKF
jgi:A/G-specific adenine glycosylase